jgi:hypothetical protein
VGRQRQLFFPGSLVVARGCGRRPSRHGCPRPAVAPRAGRVLQEVRNARQCTSVSLKTEVTPRSGRLPSGPMPRAMSTT